MNNLQTLIKLAIDEQTKVDTEWQAAANRKKQVLSAIVIERLGDIWDELQPHITETSYSMDRPLNKVEVRLCVDSIQLGLAPFYIHGQAGSNKFEVRLSKFASGKDGVEARDTAAVARFLLERKEAFPEYHRQALMAKTTQLYRQFNEYENLSEDEIRAIGAEITAVDPEKADDAARAVEYYLRLKADREGAAAAEEAYALQVQQDIAQYETAYRKYCDELIQVWKQARIVVEQMQASLFESYTVYKLTYSLGTEIIEDDEVDQTAIAWAMDPFPETDGFWRVIRKGEIKRIKFFIPVKVEEVRHETSMESCTAVDIPLMNGLHLYYAPAKRPDLETMFKTYGYDQLKPPDPPGVPETITWQDQSRIDNRIKDEVFSAAWEGGS